MDESPSQKGGEQSRQSAGDVGNNAVWDVRIGGSSNEPMHTQGRASAQAGLSVRRPPTRGLQRQRRCLLYICAQAGTGAPASKWSPSLSSSLDTKPVPEPAWRGRGYKMAGRPCHLPMRALWLWVGMTPVGGEVQCTCAVRATDCDAHLWKPEH